VTERDEKKATLASQGRGTCPPSSVAPSPKAVRANTPARAASAAFAPSGATDTFSTSPAPQVRLSAKHPTLAAGPHLDGPGSVLFPASTPSPAAAMVGHSIKGGRCITGSTACADKALGSAVCIAMKDGITDAFDCSKKASLMEGSGYASPVAGSARSCSPPNFLRSSSPTQRGRLDLGNCSPRNHAPQQQQLLLQYQQQQRAANLAGSIGWQGRATPLHRFERISNAGACGSSPDLQAAASVPGPRPPANSAANLGGLLAQVSVVDLTRQQGVSQHLASSRASAVSLSPRKQSQHAH